jgi:hypothetical protein
VIEPERSSTAGGVPEGDGGVPEGAAGVPEDGFAATTDDSGYQPWPPAARRPSTRASRRRLLMLVAAVVSGSLALAALCAGGLAAAVRSNDPVLGQPTAYPTLPGPTVSPFGGVYVAQQKLCVVSDFTRLRGVFGRVRGLQSEVAAEPGGVTASVCDVTLTTDNTDNAPVTGRLHMLVRTYPDAAAARAGYAAGRPGGALGVPDVGMEGCLADGAEGARELLALDHNVTIAVSWQGTDTAQPEAAVVDSALVTTARATLYLLRFG